MTKIEDEFRDVGVIRGMTLMLKPSDAVAFVRRCRELQVKVLGLDAFHLTDTTRQPDMNESIESLTAGVSKPRLLGACGGVLKPTS